MKPVARNALATLAVIAAGVLLVTGGKRIVERERTASEINRLRDDLYRARVGSDRCRSSLANSEASLRQLSLAIDSMRRRVDDFESQDERGVPADQYQEYLALFESYNDSVAEWEAREQRLRATEVSCRETIEQHNALSDSLQQVLENAGIEAG